MINIRLSIQLNSTHLFSAYDKINTKVKQIELSAECEIIYGTQPAIKNSFTVKQR